jgi:plastocyanin
MMPGRVPDESGDTQETAITIPQEDLQGDIVMKKTLIFASLLALSGGLAIAVGAAHASDSASPEVTVNIENFTYNPSPITVSVGATVRWTNKDVVPHDVVSDDKSFKSKLMTKGQEFSYKFTKPGTFNYVCSIHPRMAAKVVVQ